MATATPREWHVSLPGLRSVETGLWTVAMWLYVVGDIVSTIAGQAVGAREGVPLTRWILQTWGAPGLVAQKVAVIGLVLALVAAVYRLDELVLGPLPSGRLSLVRSYRLLLPGVVVAWGLWIVVWNGAVIVAFLPVGGDPTGLLLMPPTTGPTIPLP